MYWFLCSQTCQSAPCPTSSSRTSPFISFHKQYIFTVLIASFPNQYTHFSSSTTTSCSSSSTSWCKNVWNRGFTLLGYACLVNNMGQCTAKPFCLWIVKCHSYVLCFFCLSILSGVFWPIQNIIDMIEENIDYLWLFDEIIKCDRWEVCFSGICELISQS